MFKYKLKIAYDGTHYGGWQVQTNALTIQESIQKTLQIIVREEIALTGSGRTDAGVHALGQSAHFTTSSPIDTAKVLTSLNGMLPSDIRILSLEQVPSDFHARYSAKRKIYHYHLDPSPFGTPLFRHYRYHVPHRIDRSLLKTAAALFLGKQDFTSFANEPGRGSAAISAVRTLFRLDVIEEEGLIRLEFEGDGFLYKMVRNITGTLLEVASGKRPPEEILQIFAAKDRRRAGKAAPPHGLFLVEVCY